MMKRFLLCLMMLALLCGCAAQEHTVATVTPTETVPETSAATVATEPVLPAEPVTVNNVDDLLAAIAPGATIILEPGCYDLTTASNYGLDSGSLDYY